MPNSAGAGAEDTLFEASSFERALEHRVPARWMGWRLRVLFAVALLGCLSLFALLRTLTHAPMLDAEWQAGVDGRPVLASSDDADLRPFAGRSLQLMSGGQASVAPGHALLFGSPRWTVGDADRARLLQDRRQLNQIFASPAMTLHFDDGSLVEVRARPRGYAGLGLGFWLLALPALLLYLVAAVVLLAKPSTRNLLFAVMALCQVWNLLWLGVDSGRGLAPISAWLINDLPWRLGLDLTTAAAAFQLVTLHPVRLPRLWPLAALVWLGSAGVTLGAGLGPWSGAWWWGQAYLFAVGLGVILVLHQSYRQEPNPFAAVLRRFALATLVTMAVVVAAVLAAKWQPEMAQEVATPAVLVWTLFFASLLIWLPFLSRGRQLMREFALLAGLSTVATSLDLLFVSLFSLEPFASLTLALFIALAAYAGARQWMLNQLAGSSLLTTERTFEQLYRVAREVQKHPERHVSLLSQLLRDLFEPLEVLRVSRPATRTRVMADGSALIVPVHGMAEGDRKDPLSLVLRFARRGQHIFTQEDARLTDRVVEQLRRAVAYDRAVEHGRTEERLRIAQDLHDDIGARLLTLMYKAENPEMEDYLRHTLQDLKTLTRGLAASHHRLSHSAAEWKSDLQQRLTAAHVHLAWSFSFDVDLELTVVQWSALTRVLRELVSNAIYHAHASRLDISASLERGAFSLQVCDDGVGREPQLWSHGLGLGGVRKRVKLLGGEVQWRENGAQGIVCEVRIPELVTRS